MKTEESVRRMREGRLYLPGDEAILRAQAKCLEALYAYNATQPSETARRGSVASGDVLRNRCAVLC